MEENTKLEVLIPREYWKTLSCSGDLPCPRSGHTAVIHNDRFMIVFGGYADGVCFNDTYLLDLHTRIWTMLDSNGQDSSRPSPRCSHGAVIEKDEECMYIFGGSGAMFGSSSLNDMWKYDLNNRTWQQVVTSGVIPPKRYGHSLSLYKKSLIVFGGTRGDWFFNDLYSLDLSLKVWNKIELTGTIPKARYKHQALLHKNKLYIIAGMGSLNKMFGDVFAINLLDHSSDCISRASIPDGIIGHSANIYNNSFYIFGGAVENRARRSKLWKYSIKSNLWTPVTNKGEDPRPRDFHTSVLADGFIIIFGGSTQETRLNDCIAFRLAEYVTREKSPLYSLTNSVSEPSIISDTRIIAQGNVSFYSQHAILKVRVPLMSQHIQPSRELRHEIIWKLELGYSPVVVNAMLRYVYCDELERGIGLDNMLELLSLACIYWIPRLVYMICNYLAASLSPLNVIQISNYLQARSEHGLLHRNSFRANVDNFRNKRDEVSQEILKNIAQTADLNAVGILLQTCIHYLIIYKKNIELVRDPLTLSEPILKQINSYKLTDTLAPIPKLKSIKSDLLQCMKWLYKDPEFKDFTICVHNFEISCHKSVLSSGSEYFKYLFSSNFNEVEEGRIVIMEHTYEVVNGTIMYIYLGSQYIHTIQGELLFELLQASEFYRLTSSNMKDIISSSVKGVINDENVFEYLDTALRLNAEVMKYYAFEYFMANYKRLVERDELFKLPKVLLVEMLRWRAGVEG